MTAKEDRPDTYIVSLKRFFDVSSKLPPRNSEGDDNDEVYGSDDPFVRILESAYKVLEVATKDFRVCQFFNTQFSEDDTVMRVALQVFNNPYLVTKSLNIAKRLLLTLEDAHVNTPWNQRMMYLRKNLN
jgi:hypothetical protein